MATLPFLTERYSQRTYNNLQGVISILLDFLEGSCILWGDLGQISSATIG